MDEELIEQRFELVDDRLDHYGDRIDKLEAAQASQDAEEKHVEGMRLNRTVVWLFVIELVILAVEFWWTVRHA